MGRARASGRRRRDPRHRPRAGRERRCRAEEDGSDRRSQTSDGGDAGPARLPHVLRGDDYGMGIESMRRLTWLAIVLILARAAALSAQNARQASRDVAKKWQGAIVNVRVSLKVRMSVGGREVQSMDDTVEAVATVIDPSGLTVMSLTSLDPGVMMSKLMGAGGQDAEKMSVVSEPASIR